MGRLIEIEDIHFEQFPNELDKNPDSQVGTKLVYSIKIDEIKHDLVFMISGFDELNAKTFDYRIDSIVTILLLHAIQGGVCGFRSKYSISRRLYYQIMYHILPQLSLLNSEVETKLRIDAPLCDDESKGHYAGTGLSCGVDSLATVYEYTDLMNIEEYKITHLFYFKVGAHDGQIGRYDQKTEDDLFHGQLKKARVAASQIDLPLIVVETNLNEFLEKTFGFAAYEQTHTLRNAGTVMIFQQWFSIYYYASSYNLDRFSVSSRSDIAHYEKWILPLLSNDRILFYSANQAMNRVDKTRLISKYDISYDNLLVCWTGTTNCGECRKCVRTLVTLDLLGALEKYDKSFDLVKYKKNRKKYFAQVASNRNKDPFFKEIYDSLMVNHEEKPSAGAIIEWRISHYTTKIKEYGIKQSVKRIMKKLK